MLVLVLTGRAFLLSLVSLAEKGKQCYEQAASGNQQTDYPQENHNSFICCHWHHLINFVLWQWSIVQATSLLNLLKSSSPRLNHTTLEKDICQLRIIRFRRMFHKQLNSLNSFVIYDKDSVYVHIMHGDITAKKGVSPIHPLRDLYRLL